MIKSITKLAADYLNMFMAVSAFCFDLGCRSFFGIYIVKVKDFINSHARDVVLFRKVRHRNKIDGIGFNNFRVLGRINFHKVSFV